MPTDDGRFIDIDVLDIEKIKAWYAHLLEGDLDEVMLEELGELWPDED